MLQGEPKEKYARLLDALRGMERVLVAFSGGVDSAFLLHAALEALSEKASPHGVLAVTFSTPYTPREEVKEAIATAQQFGARHHIVELPLADALRTNPPERCYLCKKLLFSRLMEMARNAGIEHVLDGGNVDDLGDYRPGRRAVEELGVESPLLDADMSKQDIRDISRECGLAIWNSPAGACLLTRLPHGVDVNESELAQIDEGERFLRSLGFPAVRLRIHGDVARIETPRDSLRALLKADEEHGVAIRLKKLGYRHDTLDLEGYRMGSFNKPVE
jgi:uncharacterized protein